MLFGDRSDNQMFSHYYDTILTNSRESVKVLSHQIQLSGLGFALNNEEKGTSRFYLNLKSRKDL